MQRLLQFAFLTLTSVGAANAGLLGSNITLNYLFPDAGTIYSSDNLAVTGGVEVTCTGGGAGNAAVCNALTAPIQTVDIFDSGLTYTYTGSGSSFNTLSFNGFSFENLVYGAGITGVSLATDIPGLTLANVSFTSTSVRINLAGFSISGPSTFFTLNLEPSPAAVTPEPASFLFVLGALPLLLPVFRRRTR